LLKVIFLAAGRAKVDQLESGFDASRLMKAVSEMYTVIEQATTEFCMQTGLASLDSWTRTR
jgi:hypothetical protein